jgi:hypothetical protein
MDSLADNMSKRVTATSSFSVSIEDSIQGFILVDGKEYTLPAQLQTWAKFALECRTSTKAGTYSNGGRSYRFYNPDITVEHADGAVIKLISQLNEIQTTTHYTA